MEGNNQIIRSRRLSQDKGLGWFEQGDHFRSKDVSYPVKTDEGTLWPAALPLHPYDPDKILCCRLCHFPPSFLFLYLENGRHFVGEAHRGLPRRPHLCAEALRCAGTVGPPTVHSKKFSSFEGDLSVMKGCFELGIKRCRKKRFLIQKSLLFHHFRVKKQLSFPIRLSIITP